MANNKIKKVLKGILTPVIIICSAVAISFGVVSVANATTKDWHTPLEYCLAEIQSHALYTRRYGYSYQEIKADEYHHLTDKNNKLYCYYITYFAEDRMGEWVCGIEFQVPPYARVFEAKGYSPSNVVWFDCDLVIETLY